MSVISKTLMTATTIVHLANSINTKDLEATIQHHRIPSKDFSESENAKIIQGLRAILEFKEQLRSNKK